MIYVALLRGINVGGNRKVDMKALKATFEAAGMTLVKTYINSGNVVFSSRSKSPKRLATVLEKAIEADFGFEVKVLLRDLAQMRATAKALPTSWVNDDTMKCDVIFLWEGVGRRAVLKELPIKKGVDTVKYTPGAVLWSIPRAMATRSAISKLVGTDLYRQMTIRNANTARKLLALMEEAEG